MQTLNIAGPVLIAPGAVEQLNIFLEQVPEVPREKIFVDTSKTYEAYRAMGFGRLDFGAKLPDGLQMKAPDLGGFSGVLKYFSNVVALSPKPAEGSNFPEGVTLLGGTLVIRNGQVAYAWADRIPGDYPVPSDVLSDL